MGATLALLQRDLDAQSREIDRLGTANQLHLGEGGSEGEGEGEGEDRVRRGSRVKVR